MQVHPGLMPNRKRIFVRLSPVGQSSMQAPAPSDSTVVTNSQSCIGDSRRQASQLCGVAFKALPAARQSRDTGAAHES